MSPATAVLVPLFALVVLLAALTVSRLVRAWRVDRVSGGGDYTPEDPERLALEDEKQRLLATLKDIDHEHALGKLSDVDHQGLKRHFEREAIRVIARLDELNDREDNP